MEPYIEEDPFQHLDHQSQPSNSGLLRFRSAPTSLLSSLKSYHFNQSPTPESDQSSPPSFQGRGEDGQSMAGHSGLGLPPLHYPKHGLIRVSDVMAMEQSTQGKVVGGASNLTRQSSSPAGFFSSISSQNGYGMVKGVGHESGGIADGGGKSSPCSSRLKPGLSTSLARLPRIPEATKERSPDEGSHIHRYRNGDGDAQRIYSHGFSWNGPSSTFGVKGHQQDHKMQYSSVDASTSQNGGLPQRRHVLSHHLSLPNTSAEMEKLLSFEDTIPCKTRARRGCATQPRSIAERVRRSKISDGMRRLQDLVPNMDKQVNTADMLDFAVEYMKDLQKQYKTLTDVRARCGCLHLQQTTTANRA